MSELFDAVPKFDHTLQSVLFFVADVWGSRVDEFQVFDVMREKLGKGVEDVEGSDSYIAPPGTNSAARAPLFVQHELGRRLCL